MSTMLMSADSATAAETGSAMVRRVLGMAMSNRQNAITVTVPLRWVTRRVCFQPSGFCFCPPVSP
ncbi:MAG: hypothetical protein ACOX8N_08520 [Christensenellales bacterium]